MKRILVVEDESAIATGLRDDLEMDGFAVDLAVDGDAAMLALADKSYDLLLLDVMVPRKDGFSICRDLRASGLTTPIILLTARGEEADKIRGLNLGADDYVTKPFSPRELNARIQAIFRRTSTENRVHKFGNVRVDRTRGEATREGKRIELTALELKLLCTFLDHAGAVLSLDQLIDLVWGKNMALTDRVIYTHVNNLRSKVEANPSQPRHIISLRGLGYRFDV